MNHHMSLLRPSLEEPWAVDVVAVVPEIVMASCNHQEPPLASCSHGRWSCVASLQQEDASNIASPSSFANKIKVPIILSVWYSNPQDSLSDQKHTQAVLQLHHDKLHHPVTPKSSEEPNEYPPIFIRMVSTNTSTSSTASHAATDAVYLYVAQPSTGTIFLYKLSAPSDFAKPFAPSCLATCKVPLQQGAKFSDDDESSMNANDDNDEFLTEFVVAWPPQQQSKSAVSPMILVGTSRGNVYWIAQRLAPCSLDAIAVTDANAGNAGSTLSSIFSMVSAAVMTPAKSKPKAAVYNQHTTNDVAAIRSILVRSPTRFSVYNENAICTGDWTVTRSNANHLTTFQNSQAVSESIDWNKVFAHQNGSMAMVVDNDEIVKVELQSACLVRKEHPDGGDEEDDVAATTHMIVLTHHRHAFDATTTRLYWLVLGNSDATTGDAVACGGLRLLEHYSLDRFVDPSSVSCALVPTAHGGCYAVMQAGGKTIHSQNTTPLLLPPIFMCYYQNQVTELDVTVASNYAGAGSTDNLIGQVWCVSSRDEGVAVCGGGGVYMLTNRGLGLVVRRVLPAPASPAKAKATKHVTSAALTPGPSSVSAIQLASHLKSQFLQYYHHQATATAVAPISLKRANLPDLQAAVMQVATSQAESTSAANHLDAHHALLAFLQESGLYHRLSAPCRQSLLTMGQQIVAFRVIKNCKASTKWENDQLTGLSSPMGLLKWLNAMQHQVLSAEEGSDRRDAYLEWLCLALQEAASYRLESRTYRYDLLTLGESYAIDSMDELPAWTTQLPALLKQLLEFWKANSSAAHAGTVQIIVPLTLEASQDLFNWFNSTNVKEQYVDVQRMGVKLMRLVKIDEGTVRNVCFDYRIFEGLCEIAHDHECKSDFAEFTLDKYFESLASKTDLMTGLPFALFVLKWHSDRNLVGHVFNYGKQCPDALSQLIMDDEKLRPYRWIHSTRIGDYNGAAEALVQTVNDHSASTLKITKINLGHAKLINAIVEKESAFHKESAVKRRDLIDKKRELVNAQELLLEGGEENTPSYLLPPHHLLDLAMRRLGTATSLDDKVHVCFTALAVCASMETPVECSKNAITVWTRAIADDHLLWKEIIVKENDLSAPHVRTLVQEETVFGGLVQACVNTGAAWANVQFGPVVESEVLSKLDIQDAQIKLELPRLLHSASVVKQ
ncbi:hypothetical protein MPSEU_000003400 [Mayamaea pseudoterrestris]|nr:hypothetical protein MPSEU_000003400 [Mayamaea pseudoterrestris]